MANRADTFDRADSTTTLGTPSDGGSAWSVGSGTWGINSNRGYLVSGGGQNTAALEASATDVDVQVTVRSGPGDEGLVARWTDDNNYVLLTFTANLLRIWTRTAGSFSLLASSGTVSTAADDVMKLRADSADDITGYLNGAAEVTANTSAHNTATKHGLRDNTAVSQRFDDFSITDLAGGHTVTVNQVTETDLAQALTARKTRTLGQNTETDLAQAIAWAPKHRLVAQASEADLSQALTALKRIALGQAAETDSAQAVSWAPKRRLVAQASETDLAQPVTRSAITVAVGQVSETDAAQAITWNPKIRIIGIAAETDIAQTITTPVGNFRIGLRGDATNIYVTTEADLSQFEADAPEHGVRMKYLL